MSNAASSSAAASSSNRSHSHSQPSSSSFHSEPATHAAAPSSASSHPKRPAKTCAACKIQRRKCNRQCMLAPYFPADLQQQFLNAHRHFGIGNMNKIIRPLDSQRRPAAMFSIIFESNVRALDPVGGCYRIVIELAREINRCQSELAVILSQLELYRAQAAAAVSRGTQEEQDLASKVGRYPISGGDE